MALVLGSSAGMAAEKVMIAEFKYPAAAFRVKVIQVLLEERLGIESDTATGDHAMFYAGMHRGKGDIDIHPEIWQPNQKNFKVEYVDGHGTVVYSEKYHGCRFVRLQKGSPNVNWTKGSNFIDIGVQADGKTAIAFGAVDNLIKGGAGQAIQCMNLMFGLEETTGLTLAPSMP